MTVTENEGGTDAARPRSPSRTRSCARSPPRRAAPGRGGARSARPPSGARTSAPPCGGCSDLLRPERFLLALIAVDGDRHHGAQRAGPAGARRRHRRGDRGGERRPASTSLACTAILFEAGALYVGAALLGIGDRLHPRRRGAAPHVPPARAGRGQAQRAPAQLHRPPAPRRPAQPRHQRPRQPGPEPPADAEPDAHVRAPAHRRGRDDDRHLAVAGADRAHHRAAVALGHARRSASGPGRASSPSGAAPASSTPRSRRPSPATRS